MTRYIYALCALALPMSVEAQDYTDALRFNQNDVLGTARSQAMAGAFGAVGADLSSMSINPAGMALYRATEVGLTLGVNVAKDESSTFGEDASDDRVKVSFNQIGAAFSFGRMREAGGGAVAHNIFLGYNRLADYNHRQLFTDHYSQNSLLDYFCFNEQKTGALTGGLAYDAYLTNDTVVAGRDDKFTYNVWEDFVGDGVNPNFRKDKEGLGLISIRKRVTENGSKGDIPFGYAVNIANKFYAGGSVNIQTVSYERTVVHSEEFDGYTVVPGAPYNFSYMTYLDQDATGVCFNLGAIYKPIKNLRLGFALHSPTFFSVNERYYADITNPATNSVYSSDRFEYEYKYRTPSRFIASVAGVFGRVGMLSFDYERTNNKRSKFSLKDDDDSFESGGTYDAINDEMKNNILKASNTFRVGGELSIWQPLYLRAGYRTTTSGVRKPFYVKEPKDYAVTGGIGFRYSNFFVDLTYVCSVKKSDSWVLPDSAEPYTYEENRPAWLTQRTHSGLVTVGMRF